jgi:hypothetical protein
VKPELGNKFTTGYKLPGAKKSKINQKERNEGYRTIRQLELYI